MEVEGGGGWVGLWCLCCGVVVTYLNLYHYTQISPFGNSAPKKLDTNGHLISSIYFDYNQMGFQLRNGTRWRFNVFLRVRSGVLT